MTEQKWNIVSLDTIRTAKEVWASVVHVGYLKKQLPRYCDFLCELARSSDTFQLCVADSERAHEFAYLVGVPMRADRVKVHELVDSWPHILVLEPNSALPIVCSLVSEGYQRFNPEKNAAIIGHVLSTLKSKEVRGPQPPLFGDYAARLEAA